MKAGEAKSSISLLVISVIISAAVLYVLRDIVLPFVLAVFLSILFRPIIDGIRKRGGPSWLGLIAVICLVGSAIWGISSIVSLGVDSAIEKAPVYSEKFQKMLSTTEQAISSVPGGVEVLRKLQAASTADAGIQLISGWLGSAVGIISDGVLMMLYLVFLILGSSEFPKKLQAAQASVQSSHMIGIYQAVNAKVLRYLRVKTLFNILNALVMYTVLWIFGVDFAPVIAMLTFFFAYLPNIGSFITTVIPGFIAMVQFENIGIALFVVGILVVVQNIVGNVLEPRAMGQSLDLSPVVVLFSLFFWGWMWGIVGMVLSVPIMAILKVIMEKFPITVPLAILMSNRAPEHL